jgi:serine protease Do
MKLLRVFGVLLALVGVVWMAILIAASSGLVFATRAFAQTRQDDWYRGRDLMVLAGRGGSIGVSIRDVLPAEAGGTAQGVLIDEVRPDSPADRAGVKRGDVIVEFDGERVRSARQFTRLVQETSPGRVVKATLVREGQPSDVEITIPAERDRRRGDVVISGDFGDYMRDLGRDLGRLGDQFPSFDFNFDFPPLSGRRLGVNVQELSSQLAEHFGVRDGVLVTSVTAGSAASRAGLKAGDVITAINGQRVAARDDLARGLRDAERDAQGNTVDVTLTVTRDRQETTIRATIDAPRRFPRGRPA